MSRFSLVYSVFDFKIGSLPIYSTIEEEEAQKVAFKSQLTLSMMQNSGINVSDAIIPFPDLGRIGYVYLFKIKDKDESAEEHVASLTYLVEESKQMELYREATVLRHQAETIANQLKMHHYYEQGKTLPQQLQKLINDWDSKFEDAVISLEEQYVKRKITIRSSKIDPSIPFLFNTIKKRYDIEKLITSLLTGKSVFIVGSNDTVVNLAIRTLEEFIPHKALLKILYTDDPIKPGEADLIRIDESLKNLYKNETFLDLDKGRVLNGERSIFVERLLKDLKGKNDQMAALIIRERVLWLLDKVSYLTEAFGTIIDEKETEKVIQEILRGAPDALNIIIEIAAAASPIIEERMRSEMGRWKEKALNFAKRGW